MPWHLGLVVDSGLAPITDGTGDPIGNNNILLQWTLPVDYESEDTYTIFSQTPMVNVNGAVLGFTPTSALLDRSLVGSISGDYYQTAFYVQHVRGTLSSALVLVLTSGAN